MASSSGPTSKFRSSSSWIETSLWDFPGRRISRCGPFGFRSYIVTLEEMRSFRLPPSTHPIQVMGQIVEAQRYAFSCFVNTPGDASDAIAFHYTRGKITYVYYGRPTGPLTNFVLHKNLNVLELGEWAKAELGVNWIGGISSRLASHPT